MELTLKMLPLNMFFLKYLILILQYKQLGGSGVLVKMIHVVFILKITRERL